MPADPDVVSQNINRMLVGGAGANDSYAQQNTRDNSGWAALALMDARTHSTTNQLLTYNGAAFLFGNALQLNASILESNAVKGEPRLPSGGSYAMQNGGAPPVFFISPTGTVTKA